MNIHWVRRFNGWKNLPEWSPFVAPLVPPEVAILRFVVGFCAHQAVMIHGRPGPWRPWPHWTWTPKIPGDVEKLAFLHIFTVSSRHCAERVGRFRWFLSFFIITMRDILGMSPNAGCLLDCLAGFASGSERFCWALPAALERNWWGF